MPAAPPDGPTEPTIHAPASAAIDETFSVEVAGLDPGQHVTLAASFTDLGTEWASDATFEADADGRVDLGEDAPIAGVYDGVRPMGLVQFAERVGSDPVDTRDGRTTTALSLTASVDGAVVADATVTRTVAPNVQCRDLDPATDGVAGTIYLPDGDSPRAGIVALHGSGGEPYGRKGRMLAAEGYVVLALRYFGGPEPVPEAFAEVPVSYVGDAIDYVLERDDVTPGDAGIVGASRGTELALLAASERDDVGVVVAYAPSAYAWFGDGDGDGPPPSAWSVDGDPLPLLPHPGPDGRPEQTDRGTRPRQMFEAFVEHADGDALSEARLPVEDVGADVVLVSGGDDGVWPAGRMAETVVDAMADAPGTATHHHFPEAGHGVFFPYHPTAERATATADDGGTVVHGGTAAGAAEADRDSWTTALHALDALR